MARNERPDTHSKQKREHERVHLLEASLKRFRISSNLADITAACAVYAIIIQLTGALDGQRAGSKHALHKRLFCNCEPHRAGVGILSVRCGRQARLQCDKNCARDDDELAAAVQRQRCPYSDTGRGAF